MNVTYYKTLPKDYFDNLYTRVADKLTHNQNVCISVIRGGGARTIFNHLNNYLLEDKLFGEIKVFDPEIEDVNLTDFIKTLVDTPRQRLVIIISFEQISDKQIVLTKLDSLRRRHPELLTFLAITDHNVITNPESYQTTSSIFFSDIIYVPPFNRIQTEKMINTLTYFYGWEIKPNIVDKIYNLSGGNPRLIKYFCKEVSESNYPISNFEKFILVPQINFQLNLISKLLITTPVSKLDLLGLTDKEGKIISQLVRYYLKNYKSDIINALYPALGNTEAKIASFLIESEGRVVSIDKIANLVKMTDDNFSLWAIYKMISRLKPKLKNNFKIHNIKGRGYLLTKN